MVGLVASREKRARTWRETHTVRRRANRETAPCPRHPTHRSYPDRATAQRAVAGAERARRQLGPLYPVPCRDCGAYHLTTRPPGGPVKLTITLDLNNAAFFDGDIHDPWPEVARILGHAVKPGALYDVNGNRCGLVRVDGALETGDTPEPSALQRAARSLGGRSATVEERAEHDRVVASTLRRDRLQSWLLAHDEGHLAMGIADFNSFEDANHASQDWDDDDQATWARACRAVPR